MGWINELTDWAGLTDSGAADRAMDQQAAATREANKLQREMYTEGKERLNPYLEQGKMSYQDLISLVNNQERFQDAEGQFQGHSGVFGKDDFQADPGYQFRLEQGQKALERRANAKGGFASGKTGKALAEYSSNVASDEYGKAYNRFNADYNSSYNRHGNDYSNKFNGINSLVNYGMQANQTLAGQRANYANTVSTNTMNLGQANASAEMNRNNDMNSLWRAGIQAGGTAAGCWVARAVFGIEDPKWKDCRNYIYNIGPKWFKNLYHKHGEEFSKIVLKNKALKLILRPLFEVMAWKGRGKSKSSLQKVGGLYAN